MWCLLCAGGMEGYIMAPLHSGNQGQINRREGINKEAHQAKGHRMANGLRRGGGECPCYDHVHLGVLPPAWGGGGAWFLPGGVPASCWGGCLCPTWGEEPDSCLGGGCLPPAKGGGCLCPTWGGAWSLPEGGVLASWLRWGGGACLLPSEAWGKEEHRPQNSHSVCFTPDQGRLWPGPRMGLRSLISDTAFRASPAFWGNGEMIFALKIWYGVNAQLSWTLKQKHETLKLLLNLLSVWPQALGRSRWQGATGGETLQCASSREKPSARQHPPHDRSLPAMH